MIKVLGGMAAGAVVGVTAFWFWLCKKPPTAREDPTP